MAIGVGTRKREEVSFFVEPVRLFAQHSNAIGSSDTILELFLQIEPTAIRGWLKTQTADPRSRPRDLHQIPNFMVIHPRLECRHQCYVQPRSSDLIQSAQFRFVERLAAQRFVNGIIGAIELQIDFNPIAMTRKPIYQFLIFGQSNTIRIEHDIVDGLRQGILDDF